MAQRTLRTDVDVIETLARYLLLVDLTAVKGFADPQDWENVLATSRVRYRQRALDMISLVRRAQAGELT